MAQLGRITVSSVARVANLSRFIRPTSANTGIPAGTSLTSWGSSYTFTTANQTVTDSLFTLSTPTNISVFVNAPGVTFQRCKFLATAPTAGSSGVQFMVDLRSAGANTVTQFIDCEFDGAGVFASAPNNNGTYAGWAPACAILSSRQNGYTVLRGDVHGITDGLHCSGTGITIHSSYIHHLIQYYTNTDAVTHNDCIQLADQGCNNVTIVNNSINGANPTTGTSGNSAMQFGNTTAGSTQTDIIIERNYFTGGGWTLSGYDTSTMTLLTVRTFRIMNNRWGLSGLFGPSYPSRDSRIGWSGNVWDVSGTTGSGAVVTAGQTIT